MDMTEENLKKAKLKQIRKTFSHAGLAFVVYTLAAAASQALAAYILYNFQTGMGQNLRLTICLLAMYPVALPLFYLVIRLAPAVKTSYTGVMGPLRFLGFFVVSMGVMYIGNLIGQALMFFVSLVSGKPMINDMQELVMNLEPWMILLAAVITAPVVEELMFRKFLLDRIACCGYRTAVVMSGLMFGLAHGNFYQFFYAFALGAVFAHIYLKTGRVIYTIGLHMMVNFCGSIIPIWMIHWTQKNAVIGAFLMAEEFMLMLGFMLCSVFLIVFYWKETAMETGTVRIPKGKWFSTVFVNIGMLLFLLCSMVSFFL